ncbi:MAG: hypothetical protein WED04_02665 [Promethearchaeati archaeon SRVP18_Atabeyarchaeia-1]
MNKEIDVEHLAGLKSYLERRLKDLEEKVALYRGYIQAIDSVLTRTSFKVAADLLKESKAKAEEQGPEIKAAKEVTEGGRIELTSRADGMKLGEMTTSGSLITIVPAENVKIPADSGTFSSFFIKKILNNMIEKDDELIKSGKISAKEKMSYQIAKNSDGTLRQITISNYREDNRQKQISTTIRWTLEKSSQKTTER